MAEAVLWNELKGRKLGGHKFARQVPIGPYFADFCCRECRLVVELDGSQHAESDYDRRRDDFMSERGFSVLRMWSADVFRDFRSVCETILAAVEGRLEAATTSDLRFVRARRETGEAR
jgi:very-short-patch-repair endonuclease